MIVSDVKRWEEESSAFHPLLQKGVAYLTSRDFSELIPGKYEINGDDMFALVQSPLTGPKQERKAEHHRKYIDIQFLVSGVEIIGSGTVTGREIPLEDRLQDLDYAFHTVMDGEETELRMSAGMFAIFFPGDMHRPCCQTEEGPQKILKVVVKINKELLTRY